MSYNEQLNTFGGGLVSASSALILAESGPYFFTGATGIWSLPTVSPVWLWTTYDIKNRGTGNLTINVVGGAATIYNLAPVTSIIIPPGEARRVILDGTYWNIT